MKKAKQSKKIKSEKKKTSKKNIKKNVGTGLNSVQNKEVETRGRKTVMTEEILKKLREYFEDGYTDEEACYYSGITVQTLYNYQKENPLFLEEKKMLKNTMVRLSRRNIVRSIKLENINGQTFNSWKVLEKRDPDFLPKAVLQNEISIVDKEHEKLLKSLINE